MEGIGLVEVVNLWRYRFFCIEIGFWDYLVEYVSINLKKVCINGVVKIW